MAVRGNHPEHRRKAWFSNGMQLIPGVELNSDTGLYQIKAFDILSPARCTDKIIESIRRRQGISPLPAALFDAGRSPTGEVALKRFNSIANPDLHEQRHRLFL